MFELNKNLNVEIQKVYDSNFQRLNDVYVVDNFYEDPDRIRDYFLNSNPIIHKDHENGLNGVSFEDRRWAERTSQIEMAYEFMSDLCKQPAIDNQSVLNNQIQFRKQDFNDYKMNLQKHSLKTVITLLKSSFGTLSINILFNRVYKYLNMF